jgi:tetratricopeptide (TPR) repeat protein
LPEQANRFNLSFMNLRRFAFLCTLPLAAGVLFSACQPFRNSTTYFNLFYNMERIMGEAEEELLYIREQKTPAPTFHIPYDEQTIKGAKVYNHLDRRSMTPEETKANKIKLDSILIKGSKLLARHGSSDYIDDGVFYIGKAYFYLREWYQSQQKCEELIANFPTSRWLPDAHLVLAMNMLQQGNESEAETMLSRAIDIAWGMKRRDVLIDAFRLNADIHLANNNTEDALKPFERALTLSSDGADKALWQYEQGVVYFRSGRFQEALAAFEKVDDYSPDVLTQFQTGLQTAVTLRVLGEHERAAALLADMHDNSNFESWYGLLDLEGLNLAASAGAPGSLNDSTLAAIDSLYPDKAYSTYGIYERGVRAFRAGDYNTAFESFSKVQSAMAPFQRRAQRLASLLGYYQDQHRRVAEMTAIPLETYPDSSKAMISDAYYGIARTFTALDVRDSVQFYYDLSSKWAPPSSPQAARALYARALLAIENGRRAEADSMLEIIVANHGLSDFAADARKRLGYTEDAKVDPAAELYASGISFMKVGENERALGQFRRVINEHANSGYAPQAYYAIGLLYEQKFDNRDSAFVYYVRLIDQFPNSEHATRVRPIVNAVLAARAGRGNGLPNGDGSAPGTGRTPIPLPIQEGDGFVPLEESAPPQAPGVAPGAPVQPGLGPDGGRRGLDGTIEPGAALTPPPDTVAAPVTSGKPNTRPGSRPTGGRPKGP